MSPEYFMAASIEMQNRLDQTPLGTGGPFPGRCRAYNAIVNRSYYDGLTYDDLMNMTPREIGRFKNIGPATVKIICDCLGIGKSKPIEKGPIPATAWPGGYGYGN